jgi:hypothetical protein
VHAGPATGACDQKVFWAADRWAGLILIIFQYLKFIQISKFKTNIPWTKNIQTLQGARFEPDEQPFLLSELQIPSGSYVIIFGINSNLIFSLN